MIPYSDCECQRAARNCSCGSIRYSVVTERVEVMPDLRRMNRHDRRTMEAIARKYGYVLSNSSAARFVDRTAAGTTPTAA